MKINELKYKIEKALFSNKTILFIIKMEVEYSFLLVKNDEYIRKKCIDDNLYHNYIEETDSKDNLVVIRFTQQCNTEIQ